MEASPPAEVGRSTSVGAGTVSAVSESVSSMEYASSRWDASAAHHGSKVAATDGVVPGAK
jgi:hypothetical protein